ncbi:MAG: hypothetical protein L3K09_00275 [Thermoplasmata archaeon]|nr:hypothetical protein [Thermoplasmata archaeon]
MRAKAAAGASPERGRGAHPAAKYRRPAPSAVRAAARSIFASPSRRFGSQRELLHSLLESLREEEPLSALGGARMRRLLMETPGVRVRVRYSERHDRGPLQRCPVCDGELRPIQNRTLDGEPVTLGYSCRRCEYWTHLRRRVPVRYEFSRSRGGLARRTPR